MFNIQTKSVQIGADLFSDNYYLYKGSEYVARISRPLLPDEGEKNHVIFNVLGECEERTYCQPHDVIRPEKRFEVDALNEYLKDRTILKTKSGWVTKHQYWREYTLIENDMEREIVKN